MGRVAASPAGRGGVAAGAGWGSAAAACVVTGARAARFASSRAVGSRVQPKGHRLPLSRRGGNPRDRRGQAGPRGVRRRGLASGRLGHRLYPTESAVKAQKLHSKTDEGPAFKRPPWKGNQGRTSSKPSVRGEVTVRFIGVSDVGLKPENANQASGVRLPGVSVAASTVLLHLYLRLRWRCCPSLPAALVSHATSASLPALANRAPAATWSKEGKKRGDLLRILCFERLDMSALGQLVVQKHYLPCALTLLRGGRQIPVLTVQFFSVSLP